MRSRVAATVSSVILGAVLPLALAGQQPPPPANEAGAALLALVNVPAKNGAKLTVTSPAFAPSADIPFENTQYRGNIFPGLSWTAGPAGTKAYAVIMQDGDAMVRGGGADPALDDAQHPADGDEARCRDDSTAGWRAVRAQHPRGESAVHGAAHARWAEAPISFADLRGRRTDHGRGQREL